MSSLSPSLLLLTLRRLAVVVELPLPDRQRALEQLPHVDHPRFRVAVLEGVLRLLHGLVPRLAMVARGDVGLQKSMIMTVDI